MYIRTLLSFILISVVAHADVINISFHLSGISVYANDSNPSGAVASAGMNGQDRWNDFFNPDGSGLKFENHVLFDSEGKKSPVRITSTAGAVGYTMVPLENTTDDFILFRGWYALRGSEELLITKLPASFTKPGYKVLVYTSADSSGGQVPLTINGKSCPTKSQKVFDGEFKTGENVAVMDGMKLGRIKITGNPDSSAKRTAVCGLQIVSNDHMKFIAYKEQGSPEGQTNLRWECGGKVKKVVLLGPKGGILYGTEYCMGAKLVSDEKAPNCKLLVYRTDGTREEVKVTMAQ